MRSDLEQADHDKMVEARQMNDRLLHGHQLSPHLFWDVCPEGIDLEKHAAWLAQRVLEYGDWSDWQALVRHYGRERLGKIVRGIRSLQPGALAFCRIWFDVPDAEFRCSKQKQSR